MKILSAEQIRLWDQYTMEKEPIASIDLMERAAAACTGWLTENGFAKKQFTIFCGKGNNGADGLVIARLLAMKNNQVSIYILETGTTGTSNFQTNLARLNRFQEVFIANIKTAKDFPSCSQNDIIIDALFGSGLNRKLEGIAASLTNHINNSGCKIISIDLPGGLFTDRSSKNNPAIKATHTLSFQCFKAAFLVAENSEYIGEVHILNIGLYPGFYNNVSSAYEMVDETIIHTVYKSRNQFAHKGTFGHALLIAGSYGKIGAAVLSAKACLRSGVGLLTCHTPKCGYEIVQTAIPEAMLMTDVHSSINTKTGDDLATYKAIGIGPGIGTASETKTLLQYIMNAYQHPMVIDADALNGMASQKELLKLIPAGSILTPHPKEFERLFGETANEFDRIELAMQKAKELNVVIILKGHHTLIATSDRKGFFNSTGNAGMATGGSGDVLTGILTGLLAQEYSSVDAAILGVYLHGLAGDIAAKELSMEAMIAGDIIDNVGVAFKNILNRFK